MHRTFKQPERTVFAICLVAILFVACGTPAESETEALKRDSETRARFAQITSAIATRNMISPEDFAALKKIREKYPNEPEIRKTYRNALIMREDWAAIVSFVKSNGEPISDDDQKLLGQALVKLGRYADAVEALNPVADARLDDSEVQSLIAWSNYHTGKIAEAKAILDRNWQRIVNEKRVGDMALAGLIAIGSNDLDGAESILIKAHEIDSKSVAVTNVLAQLYMRRGDADNAEKYRLKTAQLNEKRSAEEARGGTEVQLSYELVAAWEQKRYVDVIAKANQLITSSTDKNKRATLFQYLHEAHKALGNQAEAERALSEIQRLKSQ
jgi:Flp pilus assembly protein TadD